MYNHPKKCVKTELKLTSLTQCGILGNLGFQKSIGERKNFIEDKTNIYLHNYCKIFVSSPSNTFVLI